MPSPRVSLFLLPVNQDVEPLQKHVCLCATMFPAMKITGCTSETVKQSSMIFFFAAFFLIRVVVVKVSLDSNTADYDRYLLFLFITSFQLLAIYSGPLIFKTRVCEPQLQHILLVKGKILTGNQYLSDNYFCYITFHTAFHSLPCISLHIIQLSDYYLVLLALFVAVHPSSESAVQNVWDNPHKKSHPVSRPLSKCYLFTGNLIHEQNIFQSCPLSPPILQLLL